MCLTLPLTVAVVERWKLATNGATVRMQLEATQSLTKSASIYTISSDPNFFLTVRCYTTHFPVTQSVPSERTTGRPNSSAGRMIHHRHV